jgi:hypothetical protein
VGCPCHRAGCADALDAAGDDHHRGTPQAERDAFRAFFEHYVFRGQGHPLAHLPEDQRGVLANIDRAAYGRIRATIMREMRDV